jgi:HEAT repeat protein
MQLSLEQIGRQLESESVKDRKLALAALRDVAPEDAVPLIKKVLDDPDQQMRSMAVFSLGIKPTAECVDLLVGILATEPDYGVRADAAGALGYLEDVRAFEPLVQAFYAETDWLVRFSVAVALGNLKDPRALATLLAALACPEEVMHQAAIAALGEIGALSALDRMLQFIESADWLVRQRLAEALGNLRSDKSMAALRYLRKDSNANVAEAAVISLARLSESGENSAK